MQKDMHYYGTYAMARAAGLTADASKTIATCAQFVDDNVANATLKFGNGAWVESVATAHHPLDGENLNRSDQRRVWLPFHFLPGNMGDTWTERLKCRMNSDVAQQMIDHHLSNSGSSYAIELMGITAHVYADTFSHYGFSGISSRGNKIASDSIQFDKIDPEMSTYILEKLEKFKRKKGARLHPNFRTTVQSRKKWWQYLTGVIGGWFAETLSGALGHGAVATFPDRPYLDWVFDYERPDAFLKSINGASDVHAIRHNPETYLEGCQALHNLFVQFRKKRPDLDNGDYRAFGSIRSEIFKILSVQADMAGRVEAWKQAAKKGTLLGTNETLPDYSGETWNRNWTNLDGKENSEIINNEPVWHFYQAAAMHRTYVLRDLLPSHGVIVN